MKKYVVLLVLGFLLAACASAPAPRQIQSSFPIDKPFDVVWQATIETFAELNLSIQNMEKVSGLITTDWINFQGQKNETGYCDCGKLSVLDRESTRRGRFNVYIKKVTDTSCEVKVNSVFTMIYQAYENPIPQERACVSAGKLEAEMFKRISEKIK